MIIITQKLGDWNFIKLKQIMYNFQEKLNYKYYIKKITSNNNNDVMCY